MWEDIKRYKFFVMVAVFVIVGVVQLIVYPDLQVQPNALTPTTSMIFSDLEMLCFGVGVSQDYYRCRNGDKPTLLFKDREETKKGMEDSIKKYPILKYLYKVSPLYKELGISK